jgi:parallel beta-helix repeat protein
MRKMTMQPDIARRVKHALIILVYLVLPAGAQLTKTDIEQLSNRSDASSWTFKVGENSATSRPLERLTGLIIPENWQRTPIETAGMITPPTPLPSYMDWRVLDGCTPIKDQGQCGSCWAFAAMGAVECSVLIHRGEIADLSEQWLVSCTTAGTCGGGWYGVAFSHMTDTQDSCGQIGAPLESAFPYEADDVGCACPGERPYKLVSWATTTTSVDDIKRKILQYGPVAVGVSADEVFQSYLSGVYNAQTTSPLNHAVVLVGWDDKQGKNGVWFLRNSWGPGWGENGYMRIEYGCAGVGAAPAYVEFSGDQDPNVINVPAQYPTIGAAITAARGGEVIILQPGTYTGSGNVDLNFQGKAITIRSVNPSDPCNVAATIIDCGGSLTTPHRAFTFASGETSSSILWGLTIKKGYVNGNGAGVYCYYSAPTMRDCVFTGNQAKGYKMAGGAIACYNSSPTITGCTITGNSASYYGGGISCRDASSPVITGTRVIGNSAGAEGGGIYCWVNSCPYIKNCLIAQNTSGDVGGGIYLFECTAIDPNTSDDPNTISCTISENTSTNMGGGIFCMDSRMKLDSSILWNNHAADGAEITLVDDALEGTTLGVTYSDVKGGNTGHSIGPNCALNYGTGNKNADPLFADATGGDFHERSSSGRWDPVAHAWVLDDGGNYIQSDDLNSPCIDAASPDIDFLAEPKCNGSRANMGVYGGTAEASRSPFSGCCMLAVPGDMNDDCKINFIDFAMIANNWMTCNLLPKYRCM